MIRRGYRLPFAEYPSQCFLKNNRSALQHPGFVAEAITELLSSGCIVEHDVPPFCVNPLTVADGKKLRLVIDLRHVNNYLVKPKFKYEDLRSLSQVLNEGHWFFTWDLKSGYHHVDICPDHQKYLGFAWPFSGVVRYFTFAVLPFGLSSACFCFTKLMRQLNPMRLVSFRNARMISIGRGIHPSWQGLIRLLAQFLLPRGYSSFFLYLVSHLPHLLGELLNPSLRSIYSCF